MLRVLLRLGAFVLVLTGPMSAQSRNLEIYWIDVEGGAATLIVAPSGESLLYDAGYAADDRDAKRIYARLKNQRDRLLTTDYIVDETVTRLRYDSGHAAAVRFLDLLTQAEQTTVLRRVPITASILQSAVALFRQYNTVVLSLTDCTSFVVCERCQITEAFAFDQHFLMRGISLCTL